MIRKFKILLVLFLVLGLGLVKPVKASSDLAVTCLADNDCSISPANTPLFFENDILPGDTFVQRVRATNDSGQNATFAFGSSNLRPSPFPTPYLLSDKIIITVRENTKNGPIVYGPMSLTNLIATTQTPVFLSPVNAHQYRDYYFQAEFDPTTGNDYQTVSSVFDLSFVFDMVPRAESTSSTSSISPSSSPSSASPPQCNDSVPTSAPSLYWIESDTNDGAVTLGWTSVSPVDHYAINFGTQAGVYLYGNSNVGSQTSYTVTGLTPGYRYFFQVLGVNGCMPGPRSNEIVTAGFYAGGAVVPAPEGFAKEDVLGVATASAAVSNQEEVAGAIDMVCSQWRAYIPWILLVLQFLIVLIIEHLWRKRPKNKSKLVKYLLVILTTVLSIFLFYLLRECDCYTWSVLAWLCKWYWLVALILTGLIRMFSYAFLEDLEK